ncbi:MAG: LysR family transcriptional regulator [Burkholderiaceae bacterium]
MERTDDLEAFLAIVEQGSQTAAADRLQRSLQSISRSLAGLERQLGVSLIRRTTRRSAPTEAGLAFYDRVKPALAEIEQAKAEAADRGRDLSGRLRIAAPRLFAQAFVAPAVCSFMGRFPRIEVDLKVSDRAVDLLAENLDVAIRMRRLAESMLKVRRIGELRLVTYGAGPYFERHGRPSHPDELLRHQCVVRTNDGGDDAWPFRVAGRPTTVRVAGRFRTDDSLAAREAVIRGLGIGFAPFWHVREAVERGQLEIVLASFATDPLPIYAVLPPTRTQPGKVRLFVDHLGNVLAKATALD